LGSGFQVANLQQKIETIPIIVGEENRLTAVASEHEVIESAWNMNARFECYVENLQHALYLVNLEA
jgi:hypothetical protein